MTIFRPPEPVCPPPDTTPDVARLLRDGRKAKRALKRRMKPKQQRCSERMLGPVIDQPYRELPKLPRGGDGRALVSLRPSLGPRVSTEVADPASLRRPATTSSLQHQADSLEPNGSIQVEGHPRVQSSSAPPTAVGSREASMHNCIDQPDFDVPPQQRQQQRPMHPLRPVGDKERARQSYTNAGQRTLRKRGRSGSSDEDTDGCVERTDWQGMDCEQDYEERPTLQVEAEFSDHRHTPPQRSIENEEDACSRLMQGGAEERSATVVLSSTVLLSPQGRARTPTISTAPADGSYFPGVADRRTVSQDGVEDWAFSTPPRPQTAQGISNENHPEWYSEPTASAFNTAKGLLRTPPDNGIMHHVTSMVSGVVVASYLCLQE